VSRTGADTGPGSVCIVSGTPTEEEIAAVLVALLAAARAAAAAQVPAPSPHTQAPNWSVEAFGVAAAVSTVNDGVLQW
jgi:hypothetical protein